MYLDNNLDSMKGCIMNYIDYFKRQAKNLFKDYKTKKPCIDGDLTYYEYDPKYFDIDAIFCNFGNLASVFCDCGKYIDEENFTLMNAQHIIALMVGFEKWGELIKASELKLRTAKLLLENQDKISIENWKLYLEDVKQNIPEDCEIDDEGELSLLNQFLFSEPFNQVYKIPNTKENKRSENIISEEIPEKSQNNNGEPENILCLHCGNICSSFDDFIHKADCDGEIWDLVPTNEAVNV